MAHFGNGNFGQQRFGGTYDASSTATGYPGLPGGVPNRSMAMPPSALNPRSGIPSAGYDNTIYAGALTAIINTGFRDIVTINARHPLLSRVVPLSYSAQLNVQRNVAAIVEQCATPAAHRTGFHKVQLTETSVTRSLQRFSHGLSMDKSAFESAAGPRELRLKIIGLAQAFLRALLRSTQTELLTSWDEYYRLNYEFNQNPYLDTDGDGANTFDRLRSWFKRSIDTFACMSKGGSTLLAAVANAKQMIERRNGVPDTLLVAPGVISRMTVGDERMSHAWINGPQAEMVKTQGLYSLPTYCGLSVVEVRRYGTDTKTSRWSRNVEVGEFYPMLRTIVNPSRFNPAFRSIELYNESTDSAQVISLAHAVDKSGTFDGTGAISANVGRVADEYNNGTDNWFTRHGVPQKGGRAEIEKLHLFIYESAEGRADVVRTWGDIGLDRLGGVAGLAAFARSAVSGDGMTPAEESTLRAGLATIGTLALALSNVGAPASDAEAVRQLPADISIDTALYSEVGTQIDAVSNAFGSLTPAGANAFYDGWGMANSAGFYTIARDAAFIADGALRASAAAAVNAAETLARMLRGPFASSQLFGASATPPNIRKTNVGSGILDLLIARQLGTQVPVWARLSSAAGAADPAAAAAAGGGRVVADDAGAWNAVLNGLATYDAKVAQRVSDLKVALGGDAGTVAKLQNLIYTVANEATLLGQTTVSETDANRIAQRLRRIFASFSGDGAGAARLVADLADLPAAEDAAYTAKARTLYERNSAAAATAAFAAAPEYNPTARGNLDTRGAPTAFARLPYTLTVAKTATIAALDRLRVSDKVFQAQMVARGDAMSLGERAHGLEHTHMVRNAVAARLAAVETEGISASRRPATRTRLMMDEDDDEEAARPTTYSARMRASTYASAADDMRPDDGAARMDIGAAFGGPLDRTDAAGAERRAQVRSGFVARGLRAASLTADAVLAKIASNSFNEVYAATQRLSLVEYVVASALLFTPVNRESALALAEMTDAPFGVLLFRPTISHEMGLVMVIESGPDTAQNFYNEADVTVAGDITKVYEYHVTLQFASFMHTPWFAEIVADVLPMRYRYGCDVSFATEENHMVKQDRNRNRTAAVAKPAIYACLVPINFEPINPIDITGVYHVRGLDNSAEMQNSYPLYPGAAVMCAQYELAHWVAKQVFSVSTDVLHNTLCFRGWFRTHSGADAAADFSRENNNTGHWGTVCKPGCASLRSGAMSVFAAVPGAVMAS